MRPRYVFTALGLVSFGYLFSSAVFFSLFELHFGKKKDNNNNNSNNNNKNNNNNNDNGRQSLLINNKRHPLLDDPILSDYHDRYSWPPSIPAPVVWAPPFPNRHLPTAEARRMEHPLPIPPSLPSTSRLGLPIHGLWPKGRGYSWCEEILIVAVRHDEDHSWLWKQPYCHVVYVKNNATAEPYNVPFSHGNEAPPYLDFIIKFYDRLPDRVMFLHSHLSSWHCSNMRLILTHMVPTAYDYVNFNRRFIHTRQGNFDRLLRFWALTNLTKWVGPPPESASDMHFACCAQFIVTKERIRARPLEMWLEIWRYVKNDPDWVGDYTTSREMEYVWHRLMGEEWYMEEKDPNRLCPTRPSVCSSNLVRYYRPR